MKILAALALLSLPSLSFAATATDPVPAATPVPGKEETPRIHAGNWMLGGGLSLQRVSGDRTEFALSTQAEHFFFDRFSLGLTGRLAAESGEDTVGVLGPSLTWHFFTGGNYALYVGAETLFGLTTSTVDSILTAKTGVNCFLTPSVAFGPSLFFSRYDYGSSHYDVYGLAIGFDIFL